MKQYEIFKKSLAEQLEAQGYAIIRKRKNKKSPQYDVYVFENSIQFKKALENITGK